MGVCESREANAKTNNVVVEFLPNESDQVRRRDHAMRRKNAEGTGKRSKAHRILGRAGAAADGRSGEEAGEAAAGKPAGGRGRGRGQNDRMRERERERQRQR